MFSNLFLSYTWSVFVIISYIVIVQTIKGTTTEDTRVSIHRGPGLTYEV